MIRDIRASADLRRWIAGAYPQYIGEITEFGADYARDANGVWQPDLLAYWLEKSEESEALAFVRGEPVAFALIGLEAFPFRRQATQYCLAEFWVAPEHRGGGMGRAFVDAVFARHSGTRELTVLPANERALAFWRAVLPEAGDRWRRRYRLRGRSGTKGPWSPSGPFMNPYASV